MKKITALLLMFTLMLSVLGTMASAYEDRADVTVGFWLTNSTDGKYNFNDFISGKTDIEFSFKGSTYSDIWFGICKAEVEQYKGNSLNLWCYYDGSHDAPTEVKANGDVVFNFAKALRNDVPDFENSYKDGCKDYKLIMFTSDGQDGNGYEEVQSIALTFTDETVPDPTPTPDTADAAVIVIAAFVALSLAGIVVVKKVRA